MKKTTARSGFTIIEFSLAMAFISVLLITIAIVTTNIITIYQKGLALKAVNSVGRGLVEEFTTSINSAPSVDTTSLCNSHVNSLYIDSCKKDMASKFIFQQLLGTRIAPGHETISDVQKGGVFCTGNYSYIWNTYYGLEDDSTSAPIKLRYTSLNNSGMEVTTTMENFRLVRVKDPTYRVCSAVTSKEYESTLYTNTSQTVDITTLANGTSKNIIPTPEEGFLDNSDIDLVLYELTMFPISQDAVTLRTFMPGTFILGTERGNINIERSGDYCDVKQLTASEDETTTKLADIGSEFTYCSINKFNFAARTAGL